MTQPTRSDWKIDVALTNISIAYMQDENMFISPRAFPQVPVDRKSDKYRTYNKNDFLRSQAQLRPPATESAGSGYSMSSDSYFCDKPAIHKDIDLDDLQEASTEEALDLRRDATEWVSQQLLLYREVDWVTNYFASGVWDSDITPANLWSDYTNGDPIGDIDTGKETILKNTGREANSLILGYQVWNILKEHPDFVDRIKHTSQDVVKAEMVANLLEIENVWIAKSVQATNEEGGTAAYDFIHGKHSLLCYVNPRPSRLRPSAGYAFSWRGLNQRMNRSTRVRSFEIEERNVLRVEGEEAFDHKVVSTDLGYMFNSVVA